MATAAPRRVGGRAMFGVCALVAGLLMAIAPPKASAELDPVVEIQTLIATLTACLQLEACGQSVETALNTKLQLALEAFADGREQAGCGLLGAFINQLNAQASKDVPTDVAEVLIDQTVALHNALC